VTSPPPSFYKQKVDEFLTRLDRRPGETPDMMFFRYWGDNPFTETASDHLSTFGVDVDTASYAITRAYLYKQGMLPPREAVRTEEFINYFAGGYAPPAEEGRPFSIHAEAASTPFAHESEYKLLRIGVKGREVAREKRKACSLVFVIDTSGSMRRENRLELVKDALRLLVPELDEGDSIGIVAFDFEARAVLEPVPASEREKILDAIGRLEPRRNTNVGAGLQLGFRMAASKLVRDGMNRVILLSDGVANTGVTDPNAMLEQVRAQRDLGVYLSTVGVGMGNLNDTLLEQLADRGNGRCVYVDRIEEAKKAFVEGLTGTLETIAKDVKIQVDFDPEKVLRYRLLGYENRAIADADFRNDRVDAGEVGAGHEVTALYELKLKTDAGGSLPAGRVATVHVRNKTPDFGEAQEVERVIDASSFKASFAEAAPRFRLQACAAEFAEVLRDSYWARGGSLGKVATTLSDLLDLRQSENGPRLGDDPDVLELLALVKRADALVQARDAQKDDVARTVDAIKENRFLQARVEQELLRRGEEQRNQLDEIRHQNDLLRRRLEDLLAR
jgi:Ca-activated chloride channel family protein